MDYFNTNGYKLKEDYYKDNPVDGAVTRPANIDPFEETLDDYYKRTAAADTTAMKKTA
jgi:hypothetical protein